MTLKKVLPAAILGALALTGCNTTSNDKPMVLLSAKSEANMRTLLATRLDAHPRTHRLFQPMAIKTAEISTPFPTPRVIGDQPNTTYCVKIAMDAAILDTLYVVAYVNPTSDTDFRADVHIAGYAPPALCEGKTMQPFRELIELRSRRVKAS
ncbi:MAG: hypothetical protein LCH39_00785 [Proteobacteria bacterium]|nr:hypothetical protein [Pseudomonadota bacterium]